MSKLIKLSLLITAVLMLAVGGTVLAQAERAEPALTDEPTGEEVIIAPGPEEAAEPEETEEPEEEGLEEVELDETVTAADLEVSEPRLLPDSKFYFLKSWGRSIRSTFTFNKVKKTELRAKYATEQLLELRKLAEKKKSPEILTKATEKYQKAVGKITEAAGKIKDTATTSPEVGKFLDKFTKQQILHYKILEKLEGQVPTSTLEKITVARERHLEGFGEVMQKLEDKTQLQTRLEKSIKAIEGSVFKPFKDMQILKQLEEKAPEAIQEGIRQVREVRLDEFKGNLEKMKPEVQEKFGNYMEKVKGAEEDKMEILEDIKLRLQEKPQIRERLEGVQQKIMVRVQARTEETTGKACRVGAVVPLGCKGRVIIERDEQECPVPRCIELGEEDIQVTDENIQGILPLPARSQQKPVEAIPTSPESDPAKPQVQARQRACITLWDPVCGVDGKTYSNTCWAKVAGVEVAQKGVCEKSIESGQLLPLRQRQQTAPIEVQPAPTLLKPTPTSDEEPVPSETTPGAKTGEAGTTNVSPE